MVHETSYDSGLKPFAADLNRGMWERPTDYIFACFGLALKMDVFSSTHFATRDMGILGILPYFLYMVIYLVPIIVIHSFMGQFSSSGFISAFRLSPLFKGMGYVSLFLTLSMLIYYVTYAALPLFFIINSFRPTLPWSCEGLKSWYNESTGRSTICNVTPNLDYSEFRLFHVPSVLFFENNFRSTGGLSWLNKYVTPKPRDWAMGTVSTFIIAIQAFGAGWGSVIALSSFNRFKTDIITYSWIISFGQIFIYIMFGLVSFMLEHYFSEFAKGSDKTYVTNIWLLILSSASALSTMGWPNLWTIIYYTTLLMAAVISITTQIFTVLQTLFDEFEDLRKKKKEITFGLIGGLAVCSLFFCTNHGNDYFIYLAIDAIFSHSVLHLLLLLVVLWIYGRERFQRDIEFMLGQPFAFWKIYILRFIAPVILVISMVAGISLTMLGFTDLSVVILVMSITLVWLPILAIPGYGFYYLSQSTGSVWDRLRRTCRPTDWYPVEMEYRQKYEETIGTTDTHQLSEVTDEVK
ncbi:sodium-dependent proline transporter-like isoform X2 [Drosophila takahashii]|uniref:sodium-dependent proline transporter-like isoform X2 n=1 Tax=Drosophila takahashii TaxID=29030 RepID=UPI001CF8BE13|nr:sodium-dependent proline transporter-like isoform X2 [Drosophila takahashii]